MKEKKVIKKKISESALRNLIYEKVLDELSTKTIMQATDKSRRLYDEIPKYESVDEAFDYLWNGIYKKYTPSDFEDWFESMDYDYDGDSKGPRNSKRAAIIEGLRKLYMEVAKELVRVSNRSSNISNLGEKSTEKTAMSLAKKIGIYDQVMQKEGYDFIHKFNNTLSARDYDFDDSIDNLTYIQDLFSEHESEFTPDEKAMVEHLEEDELPSGF